MENDLQTHDSAAGVDPEAAQSFLIRTWWLNLIRGLAAFLLGVSLLVQPEKNLHLLVNFIGVFWLTSGLLSLMAGMRARRVRRRARGFLVVAGIVGIVGGVFVLLRETATNYLEIEILVVMFGVVAILTGIIHIFGGFRTQESIRRERSRESLILGWAEVGLGLIVVFAPSTFSPITYFAVVAWSLAAGVVLIRESLRMRRLGKTGSAERATAPD